MVGECAGCPLCGGEVGKCAAEGCTGCHYLVCRGCGTTFDLCDSLTTEQKEVESLEELQAHIVAKWNAMRDVKPKTAYEVSAVERLNEQILDRSVTISSLMLQREILKAELENYRTRYLLLKQATTQ